MSRLSGSERRKLQASQRAEREAAAKAAAASQQSRVSKDRRSQNAARLRKYQENAAAKQAPKEVQKSLPNPPASEVPPQTPPKTTQTPQFGVDKTGLQGPESPAKSKNPPGKPKKEPLRYPFDIISDTTDYLKIDIVEYVPAGFTLQQNVFKAGLDTARSQIEKNKNIIRSIFLPIPQNIEDSNAVGWGEDSLNSLAAYGVGASADVIKSGNFVGGVIDMIKNGATTLGDLATSGQAQDLTTTFFASQAANLLGANTSFEGLLARSSGQILNPNKELLFNGVNLRSFNFSFNLAPRGQKEAQNIKEIIRTLKINMNPRKSSGTGSSGNGVEGLFLKSPNVFEITYMTGNGPHKFLNRFITAALVNMNVNYTGSGTYMTYGDADKTPVHMTLNLSFQELNPIYAEDYDSVLDGVGY